MKGFSIALMAAVIAAPLTAVAHPGGLNSEGCHNDRRNGGYHCHRSGNGSRGSTSDRPRQAAPGHTDRVYANCAAARAAGAAPVRRGDPGYGPHLDRDDDGIGCE